MTEPAPPSVHELREEFRSTLSPLLVDAGWVQQTADVFTFDLDGYSAWLSVAKTARGRLRINPMIGVRHDAIMELEHTLAKTPDTMQATLSEPLRNLDPGGDLIEYFDISEPSLIGPEVQRLVELVVLHGPRFARPLGTTSSVISALRDRAHVANVTVAQMRLPVALLIDGQKSEARKAMNDALSETRGSTSADGQVRSFSTAFFAHLMTLGR